MSEFEFRDKERAKRFSDLIHKLTPEREVKLVHVCGTHENTVTRFGIRDLLPENLEIRMGPGCPVCVTSQSHIDEAIQLSRINPDVTIATYGDLLRVPGSEESLADLKSEGYDVEVVTSVSEALQLSEERETVFLGIGFETTAATLAPVIREKPPENFSVLLSQKRIPPAMDQLLKMEEVSLDGFIAPGHVSTIIGTEPYQQFSNKQIPVTIAGFEPLDFLYSIAVILKIIKRGEDFLENTYQRCVDEKGNLSSLKAMREVFDITDMKWRGLGTIPDSGFKLKRKYEKWSAREKYDTEVEEREGKNNACICDQIVSAISYPEECPLFADSCTPQNPVGPCMVSKEGMCRNWYENRGIES